MPALFSEAILEQAIIDKFVDQGYEYALGDNLHRELTDEHLNHPMSCQIHQIQNSNPSS